MAVKEDGWSISFSLLKENILIKFDGDVNLSDNIKEKKPLKSE